jgi:hypothetical protein
MKLNPFINALAIVSYILLVVGIIYALQSPNTPDKGILAPLFLLSLFTLSVAVMTFLFFYQPFKLYCNNRQKEGLTYFIKTIGYLAVVVLLYFFTLLYFRTTNSITFPKGGETLLQGESYQLTWTGGREETLQIALLDMSRKDENTSASISDKIYGIENKHGYTYTIPTNTKPGTYRFQIGSQTSQTFEIISK